LANCLQDDANKAAPPDAAITWHRGPWAGSTAAAGRAQGMAGLHCTNIPPGHHWACMTPCPRPWSQQCKGSQEAHLQTSPPQYRLSTRTETGHAAATHNQSTSAVVCQPPAKKHYQSNMQPIDAFPWAAPPS